MAKNLKASIKDCFHNINANQRFVRPDELSKSMGLDVEEVMRIALAAGARYRLPRTTLIHKERMEEFMKHLYKVPGTSKYVQKKYVRIGEGSITYSIGHHRFVEMARAAGAVYKIGDAQGNTVLVNLELFDEYMEQFRQPAISMKHELYSPGEREVGV